MNELQYDLFTFLNLHWIELFHLLVGVVIGAALLLALSIEEEKPLIFLSFQQWFAETKSRNSPKFQTKIQSANSLGSLSKI